MDLTRGLARVSTRLAEIAAYGNRFLLDTTTGTPSFLDDIAQWRNVIVCRDGYELSVVAGIGTRCRPEPGAPADTANGVDVPFEYSGPYQEVEVSRPTARPEPWRSDHTGPGWRCFAAEPARPTDTTYPYVPVLMVARLIRTHGGEAYAYHPLERRGDEPPG